MIAFTDHTNVFRKRTFFIISILVYFLPSPLPKDRGHMLACLAPSSCGLPRQLLHHQFEIARLMRGRKRMQVLCLFS
jgi:hypothetical protein